ncbi:MAG: N-acylglucosamine 2-epimerase [Candidatus Omnitrophota bacterium]|nr:MAG: N-acylglucosamine 2-epimerase [Candidatus Omnitrophota bacterium]
MRLRVIASSIFVFGMGLFFSLSIAAQTSRNLSADAAREEILASKPALERILLENIIPFWHPQVIDADFGGYRLNHDKDGKWKGRGNKGIVTQARTVWFYSRLINSDYAKPEYLDAARYGFNFLSEKMWDKQYGGFYWEVDSAGAVMTKPDKHLYGQAFALYALSEFAKASGDRSVEEFSRKLYDFLEFYAHDSLNGGYHESFRRDWFTLPITINNYMSVPPNLKLMNTHLHLMEALTTHYLVTKAQTVRERLIELIFIESNSVVRKNLGACTDKYNPNWIPLRGPSYDRVSYGHDVENVWLLIDACKAVGISNGPFMDLYHTLFGYSLQFGFDQKNGGFYDSGAFRTVADRRDKVWWVQAEGLVAALKMYQLTGESVYANCYLQTLDWLVKKQVDWENGDWHSTVSEDGTPSGDKAGLWKSPYHNGRAVLECLEIIKTLSKS